MKIRLLDGSGTISLRYLREYIDSRGKPRVEFRRKGQPIVPMKAPLGSEQFLVDYRAALSGRVPAGTYRPKRRSTDIKSIRWLIEECYFKSAEFLSEIGDRTRYVRRGILEAFCNEPCSTQDATPIGTLPFNEITTDKIRVLRDRKAGTPEQANALVKALRQIFKVAIAHNHMSSNPANDVPYIKTSSEGFHTWTVPEVEQYRTQHVVGTKARLALELLLYLGGRRSDVVSFGRQHVRTPDQMPEEARAVHPGRWLHYMQHKNRHRKPVVLTIPILEELEAILAASPIGELTWLVNDLGRPFTSNGFGNKMRDWCDQAGLLHCSAHGLRKAGATIAAERGASDRALMSIFGWTTSKQAAHYTRKADQMRLAGANMKLLAGRR